jgi:hypothetical protein
MEPIRVVHGEEGDGSLALAFRPPRSRKNRPSSTSLLVIGASSGVTQWQGAVPVESQLELSAGRLFVETSERRLSALRVSDGHELYSFDLPKDAYYLTVRGDRMAICVERSASSSPERPVPCGERDCAIDLWIFSTESRALLTRVALGARGPFGV